MFRYARLAAHLLGALAVISLRYPFIGADRQLRYRKRWSQGLLEIFNVRVDIDGAEVPPACLLVANHISWLDIFVINSVWPAAFVAKAEIRQWPLFGKLAAGNETVFLRRGSRGHARVINQEIGALLALGRHVAVFPEGTTTDGQKLLSFHGALLQPAILTGASIQPLCLAYRDSDGNFSRAPAYDDDVSLLDSIHALIAAPALIARIRIPPELSPATGGDRKELARAARAAILDRLGD